MSQDRIVETQKQVQAECTVTQENILVYAETNTGYEQVEFCGQDIFSEEKMAELRKMGEALLPLWQRSPEAIKPFVCRHAPPPPPPHTR